MAFTIFCSRCAARLYAMRAQALCESLQERLPYLRQKAAVVHDFLEAARSAAAASEAWKQAPGLGAALTAAMSIRLLHGTPCCCSALCWPNYNHSGAWTCRRSETVETGGTCAPGPPWALTSLCESSISLATCRQHCSGGLPGSGAA